MHPHGRWQGGQGEPCPSDFTYTLLNLPNFKNSLYLVVNTGSILIAPLEKYSADAYVHPLC